MPPPTNNTDHPDTLPLPELNPLLNPVLGQHMGRWAEVYFTSPPEKREEAVLELLRELQAEGANTEVAAQVSSPQQEPASAQKRFAAVSAPFVKAPPAAETQAGRIQLAVDNCRACGFENPPDRRFCGMCGTRLREEAGGEGDRQQASSREEPFRQRAAASVPSSMPQAESAHAAADEFPWREKFSLFHAEKESRRGKLSWLYDSESEDTPRSYRPYLGATLAILILVLGFVAWHNFQHSQDNSQSAATSAPAASEPAGEKDAAPENAAVPAPAATADATPVPPSKSDAQAPVKSGNEGQASQKVPLDDVKNSEPRQTSASPRQPAIPASRNNSASLTPEPSSEDLAMAQGYLNGTKGEGRNSAAAAMWLWRAVSKQNAEATLLLSDLYLKGDGVTKNCDQARVLLDVAARKGMKDAGEKLRHMQAFGCE